MTSTAVEYLMVETPDALRGAADGLAKARAIIIDLEGDTLFHYGETLCLMQVSDGERTWLVDPLRIDDLSPLAAVLANGAVEKVLHGADYDLRLLRRHLGIECRPIFDTELASRFLGARRSGLADVLSKRFGVTLDKKFQKRDWSQRPLPAEMCSYAASDVRWLPKLAAAQKADLERLGRTAWVAEECDLLARSPDRRQDEGPLFLRFRGAALLDRRSLAVLEAVLRVRETLARERDRPPFKVLDPAAVGRIVEARPETEEALRKIDGLRRRSDAFCAAVVGAVREGCAVPDDRLPSYPRGGGRRQRGNARFHVGVQRLKEWRDRRAAALGIDGSLVCTAAMITALAGKWPVVPEALDAVEGIRNWQKKEFGAEICDILRRAR